MKEAIVNSTIASLRKDPHRRGELIDEDFYGDLVEIVEENKGGWDYIKTSYGYCGYVHSKELIKEIKRVADWKSGYKRVLRQPFADILDAPSVRSCCLMTLCKGTWLRVLSAPDIQGYVQIGLCGGETGYIKESFLNEYKLEYSLESEEQLRYDIIQTAKSYMGCQYRWGGKSPLGLDCSGLSFMAYWLNGITIYRDAAIAEGFPVKQVPEDRKKPGDLLYFGGHVAIYLGEERYIHSTARKGSDGVVINSLDPQDILYREDLAVRLKEVGSIFPFI